MSARHRTVALVASASFRDGVIAVGMLLTMLWIGVLSGDEYAATVASTVALYAMSAIGLNVLFGYAGDLSLGQAGFVAVASYVTVIVGNRLGLSYVIVATGGVLAAGAAAALVGIVALRTRGLYLAMITVAVGLIVESLAKQWVSLTGGPSGMVVESPLTFGGDYLDPGAFAVIAGVMLATVYWLVANLQRNQFGRAWKATQASRIAAASSGLNTYRLRLVAFVISGLLAGVAGALYPLQTGFISSDSYTIDYSVFVLLAVLVGGAGSRLGPVIGVALLTTFLQTIGTSLGDIANLIYGALFIVIIYLAPEGLAGLGTRGFAAVTRARRSERATAGGQAGVVPVGRVAPRSPASTAVGRAILRSDGITKDFPAVRALDDANLEVATGSIHGIIGANGSGKSTLLNILSGVYTCDAGRVVFNGDEIQNLPAHEIAKRGLARTFQTSELFSGLTVIDNVVVASRFMRDARLLGSMLRFRSARHAERAARQEAAEMLGLVGLGESAQRSVDTLAPGHGRLLEVARALASHPHIVILDEPAAGLDSGEVDTLANTLATVRSAGITVLVVEHRMELIARVADYVTVLDGGRTIAHGAPHQIQRNDTVIASYLGESRLAI